jgi:type I restriction enzyme S subunit
MIRIRADQKIISTEYLYHALSSPKVRNEMREKAKGSAGTMPKINQSILQNLEIPYCDSSAQLQIVNRIEERLSNAESIYRLSEVGIKKSSTLKNSILVKIYQQNAPIGAKNMEIL